MNLKHLAPYLIPALLPAGPALADTPDPTMTYLEDVTYSGNLCPDDSATVSLTDDGRAVTVIFSDGFVEADGYVGGAVKNIESCRLDFTMHIPNGWQYTLMPIYLRGYADLDRGTRGNLQAVMWQDGERTYRKSVTIKGKYNDLFTHEHDLGFQSLSWSSCSDGVSRQDISIKTRLKVQAKANRYAYMSLDSFDTELTQQYGFVWRQCNPDNKKKWLGVCTAKLTGAGDDNGTFVRKAVKNWKKRAKNKAKSKALDACQDAAAAAGQGQCNEANVSCQTWKND